MWYGYVGHGIKTVFDDYKKVERLALRYPYSSYRKFRSSEAAWDWVSRQSNRKKTDTIIRYGNIFTEHYVTIEYFIGPDTIYYNVRTKKLGYVKLVSEEPDVSIENRTELIKVRLKDIELNPDLIISHLIAIYHIMRLLGNYVDAEVVIPDHSIFYTLTEYAGNNRQIVQVLNFLKQRKGNVALTLREHKTATSK